LLKDLKKKTQTF